MKLRITTLSDNVAAMGDFRGEWGLSLLVETENTTILLDTGMSGSAVHNADALGIDLKQVDKIVLSHGHYDHTGGLRDVLRRMKKKIDVIAHPSIWQSKYSRMKDRPERFIGVPFRPEELESLGAVFRLSVEPVEINRDIITTGEVPLVTEYEAVDSHLFLKEGSVWLPDPVMDDRALVIKTGQGLVIVSGCAHRGIINTIFHAQEITGVSSIYAVIGGSHLMGTSDERLKKTVSAFKELGVQKLGLCHCTDLPVISVMAREFGKSFIFNKAGTIIELT
jgi:7,8-dihydropterin-6-yl-methyl-4-(beta-D-ribofuranosyl)aminobenzene 5'-phosphate synthase